MHVREQQWTAVISLFHWRKHAAWWIPGKLWVARTPSFCCNFWKKTRLLSLNLRVLRNNTDAIFGNFQTLAEITCSEAAGLRLSCNITPQGHIRTQYFTQCCNVLMNMITLLHSLVWSSQLLLVQWVKHSRLPWQECLFIFRVWTQSLEQRSWKSQHNLPGWRL